MEKIADSLNIFATGMMGLIAFVALFRAPKSGASDGVLWALYYFLVWCAILFVSYLVMQIGSNILDPAGDHYWGILLIDAIGNAALFACAYALYKDTDYTFDSSSRYICYALGCVLIWIIVLGSQGPEKSAIWRVFVISPSLVLACCGFIAIGISVALRVGHLAVPVVSATAIYALMQVPAYFSIFVLGESAGIKIFLAGGKVLFALILATVVFMGVNHATKTGKPLVSYALTVLSILLTISLIIVKLRGG